MARARGAWRDPGSDDDLVEIRARTRPQRRPNMLDSLLDVAPARIPVVPRPQRPSDGSERHATPAVIDLTQEPDSPGGQRPPQPRPPAGRNPRRTNSQRLSPPRLARSDSLLLASVPDVIDLTDDAPAPRVQIRRTRRYHRPLTPPRPVDQQYYELQLRQVAITSGVVDIEGFIRSGMLQGINDGTVWIPGPRPPTPKPPMEDTPPTRDGFTRDTCSASQNEDEGVVVCPACNEELAYDPSGASPHGSSPHGSSSASRGKKRKRAAGQHHFWALKKCGHVYCADCFENRKPTKTAPDGVGFQSRSGKPPASVPNDLRCAVDGCETKVATRMEWIGIFL